MDRADLDETDGALQERVRGHSGRDSRLHPTGAPDMRPANPAEPDFSDACGACRGHCCRNGGNVAYLDKEAMNLAWSRLPHLSKDDLLSAYIGAVPDMAFENSCIFHAEGGLQPAENHAIACLQGLSLRSASQAYDVAWEAF
jgi:hypothetical protein